MENKLTKEKVWKVSKIVLNVLFYVLIVLILFFAIANMKVKTIADIPNIFGGGFLSVQSDSMDGNEEDSFKKGDLIFVKKFKKNDKRIDELEVGDIVTYFMIGENELNTHRIVEISTVDGVKTFTTQGDKAALTEEGKYVIGGDNEDKIFESIYAHEVIAVHTSTWSGKGNTLDFLQSPLGFGLCIVLPAVIILIIEAYFLIRNVLRLNKEKLDKEYQEKDEAMRKQIMEELKKEQAKESEEEK